MEFLRFGSSIPGSYWGCCAMCIIQNFKFDPEAKASIQLVSGDGGGPITRNGKELFVGGTYHDVFKQRIRLGTFSKEDMPNHGFLAVLTTEQLSNTYGKKWLAILKEEGFEFIRTVDNSVYTGSSLTGSTSSHPNHLFGLFRNITGSRIKEPFTPPDAWTSLPDPYGGDMSPEGMTKVQQNRWIASGPTVFKTEDELVAEGAPVTLAGLRSQYPQQEKTVRDSIKKHLAEKTAAPMSVNAFPQKVVLAA